MQSFLILYLVQKQLVYLISWLYNPHIISWICTILWAILFHVYQLLLIYIYNHTYTIIIVIYIYYSMYINSAEIKNPLPTNARAFKCRPSVCNPPRLQKLQRSGVQLSERLACLGISWGLIELTISNVTALWYRGV